ncbi:ubiquitin carboxyl-terminal hydrolase 15-like isoform X1 [Haliotis asinina]|uniref:ubiquitin carboxyl-terminal hydrolase 15-like isoform X1 n=1 Tax=Haliotis asinina TaxID=109174 RepID=UPI0035323A0A
MAEGGPPDCETQKSEISNLLKLSLKKGETWYLVDIKWFKQWKKFVGYDSWDSCSVGDESTNPGPIDNSALLKDNGQLKEHLVDDLDYTLFPAEAWNKLLSWYGMIEGQDPISRCVIEDGMYLKQLKVEVYLYNIVLSLYGQQSKEKSLTRDVSRAATIADLEKMMRQEFSISEDKEVRLWNRYMSSTYEHLNKPDNTLQDAGLYQGQVIVIEEKNEDGTWPRQAKSTSSYNSTGSYERSSYTTRSGGGYGGGGSSYESGYSYGSYDSGYSKGSGAASPGLCGLANLGNTCFMNSALQCMSNVPQLTDYMIDDKKWEKELNEDNPLGNKGEIAKSYAELIKTMWSGRYSYTVPRNFKVAVGRFAPQFSGYQQQDSQELMAFLLDGLHEDMNRIRKKPYVELKDDDGRPDAMVAAEAWENYRKRNDSIIVDIFHGLLKSTVKCPECSKISVTFDPFCYLSLPLPIKKERQMEVFWVPLAPKAKPVQLKLTVPKMGIVGDICKALSSFVNVPSEKMVVTDVYNHRFHRVFALEEGLNHILDRDDIFVYEVPVNTAEDPNTLIVPVYLREKRSSGKDAYVSSNQLFGQPLLLPVPKGTCSYDELYNLLLQRMSRYVKTPKPSEQWWVKLKRDDAKEDEKDSKVDMGGDGGDNSSNNADEKETLEEEPQVNGEVSSMDTNVSDDELETDRAAETMGEDEEEEEEEDGPRRLFTFSQVNSYGSSELDGKLLDDGRPLKLTSKTYIALDWDPLAKEKFYIEKDAEDFEQHDTIRYRSVPKRQAIQLNDCLKIFTDAEKLSEHDPWYCPSCKRHQQATKKFDLWSLPNVLIIHLKRFSYNRYWRDKIDALVEFPTEGLDLRKYIINPEHGRAVYDLIAVSNHYGGLGGGHYTAFAKNKEENEWHYFDDSSVSQSSEEAVVTKAAYVLVYQKREQKMPPPSVPAKTKSATVTTASASSAAEAETSCCTNGLDSRDSAHCDDIEMDTST